MNKRVTSLPQKCLAVLPGNGQLVTIIYGESGYRRSPLDRGSRVENRMIASRENAKLGGVSVEQERLMIDGAVFGWDTVCRQIEKNQYRARNFIVELSSHTHTSIPAEELVLPAEDYALLDVFEQLSLPLAEKPDTEVISYAQFEFLAPVMEAEPDLLKLNRLLQRLNTLDSSGMEIFEMLIKTEMEKAPGAKISVERSIDLAYSTDCCDLHPGITTDEQLGRVYAENGFLPELLDLPENVFNKLDFEQIGRENREAEGGVFTASGYVVQHTQLKEVSQTLDYSLHRPDYSFRLILKNDPFQDENQHQWRSVPLDLPATEEALDAALEKLGAPNWDSVILGVVDSAIPDLLDNAVPYFDGMQQLNELAKAVMRIEQTGEMLKYKAVLTATGCTDIDDAIQLTEHLDDYVFNGDLHSPPDVALGEISIILARESAKTLVPHIDLYSYGSALIRERNSVLTGYGLVKRLDLQPIQAPEEQPRQGGMEMA